MSSWVESLLEIHSIEDPRKHIFKRLHAVYVLVIRNTFMNTLYDRYVIDGLRHKYKDIHVCPYYRYKGKFYIAEDPYALTETIPGFELIGIMVLPNFFYDGMRENMDHLQKYVDAVPMDQISQYLIPVKYAWGNKKIMSFSDAPEKVRKNYQRIADLARGMTFAFKAHNA